MDFSNGIQLSTSPCCSRLNATSTTFIRLETHGVTANSCPDDTIMFVLDQLGNQIDADDDSGQPAAGGFNCSLLTATPIGAGQTVFVSMFGGRETVAIQRPSSRGVSAKRVIER